MERDGSASGPDVIRLVGLGGVGRHGVLEEERRDGQTFLVDLALHLDTSAAAASDDLDQTVNYADVATAVVALIEGEPVRLIETLASRIADTVLAHDLVHSVEVTVHKPEAPVGVPFTDVQVSIHRGRTTAGALGVFHAEPAVQAAPMSAAPAALAVPAAAVAANEGVPVPEPAHEGNGPGADLDREPDGEVEVVLALGGNVGDVRATLRAVVEDLGGAPGLDVQTVSPLARTAAVLEADAVAQQDYLNAVVLATTTLSPNALLELTQSLETSYGRQRQERWGERTLDIDLITYDGVTSSEEHLALPHPRANERAFVLVPWAQADPDAFLPGLGGGPVAVLAETAPDRAGVRWLALDWLEHTGNRTDSGSFVVAPKASPSRPEDEPADPPAQASAEPLSVEQSSPPSESAPGEPVPGEPVPDAPSDPSAGAAGPDPAGGLGAGSAGSVASPAADGAGPAVGEDGPVEDEAGPAVGGDDPAVDGDGPAGGAGSLAVDESAPVVAEPEPPAEPVGPPTPERGVAAGPAEPAVIEPETGMPPAFEPDDEAANDGASRSDDAAAPEGDFATGLEREPAAEPTPAPQPAAAREPQSQPEPTPVPEPVPEEPTSDSHPEPASTADPESQRQPESAADLELDSESDPTPESEPGPAADPTPESESGPAADLEPEAASEPEPSAEPTSVFEPDGAPHPEGAPEPAPEPEPEPEPGAVSEAAQQTSVSGQASESGDGAKDASSPDFRPRWQPLRGDQDT